MTTATSSDIFESVTFKIETPDGTAYMNIIEDQFGAAIRVNINAGKCGTSFSAWAGSVCGMITHMLENRYANIPTIISLLSDYHTDKSVNSRSGQIPVRSGVHGIKLALLQYLQYKNSNVSTNRTGIPRIPYRRLGSY